MPDDIVKKFWNGWLKSGTLEREEKIQNLPVIAMVCKNNKLLTKAMVGTMLNSLFEDLESVLVWEHEHGNKKRGITK